MITTYLPKERFWDTPYWYWKREPCFTKYAPYVCSPGQKLDSIWNKTFQRLKFKNMNFFEDCVVSSFERMKMIRIRDSDLLLESQDAPYFDKVYVRQFPVHSPKSQFLKSWWQFKLAFDSLAQAAVMTRKVYKNLLESFGLLSIPTSDSLAFVMHRARKCKKQNCFTLGRRQAKSIVQIFVIERAALYSVRHTHC